MTWYLITLARSKPMLINDHGMIVEPEPGDTGRTILTLPHTERDGKARMVLSNSFDEMKAKLMPPKTPDGFVNRTIPISEDLPPYDQPLGEEATSEPAPKRKKKV